MYVAYRQSVKAYVSSILFRNLDLSPEIYEFLHVVSEIATKSKIEYLKGLRI